jgi:hypothetical protein
VVAVWRELARSAAESRAAASAAAPPSPGRPAP